MYINLYLQNVIAILKFLRFILIFLSNFEFKMYYKYFNIEMIQIYVLICNIVKTILIFQSKQLIKFFLQSLQNKQNYKIF